jgi:methylenetetrahydrofolate dehydrogenase (NADP+)/methenyltetrahydrofolate cyclohydrolase
MTVVMSGKEVAEKVTNEIEKELAHLSDKDITPTLAIVRVGEDSSSATYEKSARKKAEKIGVKVESFTYASDMTEEDFLAEFERINNNQNIHGILVMRPLPEHIDASKVGEMLNPKKDVDGMSSVNLGKIMINDQTGLLPSTPAAVMEMLDYYEIELEGKDVLIIGHSAVVGKPLDILLLNKNATVMVSHIYSKDIQTKASQADIVISATGKAGLVTADYIKEGAVVIDVGISYKNGEIHGDVMYDEVKEKAGYITPVPGGVGAVTTTMLIKNILKSAQLFLTEEQKVK